MIRTLILSILIYTLILAGLATFTNGVIAISILLILYLASGIVFGPGKIVLEIEREINPERVSPDAPVEIILTITNLGSHIDEALFVDNLPPNLEVVQGTTSLMTEFGENQIKELRYTVKGKRGIYHINGVNVTANDAFAIFRRKEFIPAQGSIFIMPYVPKIRHVDIRPRQTRVYSGNVPARVGGPGVEFFGVREYHWGDALHRINWKATARHNHSLYSNEYEQERVADVGLILDARKCCDVRTPNGTLFEHLITSTAALTDTLIKAGNRVGLLVYGGFLDWTFPGYGKVQRERIFQALTRAQTGDSLVFEKLENLPTKVFPTHSQLILFSPLLDDDIPILVRLRARGYQVMIISPDPILFQCDSLQDSYARELGARLARIERKLLFNKLRHAGIVVMNWDVRTPFDQAMNMALRRIRMWSQPPGGRL